MGLDILLDGWFGRNHSELPPYCESAFGKAYQVKVLIPPFVINHHKPFGEMAQIILPSHANAAMKLNCLFGDGAAYSTN